MDGHGEVREPGDPEAVGRKRYEPRHPSDLLPERQALARRLGSPPRVPDLLRHAERFGTEMVPETAVEAGYGLDTCTHVVESCSRIDSVAGVRRYVRGRLKKQLTPEARARELMGLPDDDVDDGG
jgi:hypothetical protein